MKPQGLAHPCHRPETWDIVSVISAGTAFPAFATSSLALYQVATERTIACGAPRAVPVLARYHAPLAAAAAFAGPASSPVAPSLSVATSPTR